MKRITYLIFITLFAIATIVAQRPGGGRPPIGQPGPGGRPPMGMPGQRPSEGPKGDWIEAIDQNSDGRVDAAEMSAAIDRTFAEFDRDNNGSVSGPEARMRREPAGDRMNNDGRVRDDGIARRLLPPFFFSARFEMGVDLNKPEFERVVRGVFNQMDANSDGYVDKSESRPPKGLGRGPNDPERPMRPNAQFIAAELRFGDKLVKDKPFSAEIQIEDTRRLFDGTTVTRKITGSTYRDSAGRTRREQPIDIAGIGVVGTDNKPQMLVFINDFSGRTQYFLDASQKIARRSPLGDGSLPDPRPRAGAQVEELGTREIEGVQAKGTRESFEIPAGQLGNLKPIQVVTEVWFSSELQMIVMSKHLDPIAGEHIFRLVNIRRTEPLGALFEVPSDYKVVGKQKRDGE